MADTPSEKEVLLGHLAAQRRHVLTMLEGLDEEQLRRAVLPSGWSLLQLVHHLAVDDEAFWFACVVGGDEATIAGLGNGWEVPKNATGASVVGTYERAAQQADAVLAGVDLDDAPAWWPEDMFGAWRMGTVREVVLHVLTETAVHAGHLDAVRELLDGRQWRVLD
ncbi:DinB family protein [Phycicoccus flavus]|uniref:DinB family protein n=1 Tax=Phycicoccus flavus TaxID=2502783 RepID=UPI000FEB6FDF|nr:DinB family protein [Phycicoccus flavus]NHA69900.1 DUF664 domain-containing protein [Phycicoccus flavus]